MCWSRVVCAGYTPGGSWKNTYWRLTQLKLEPFSDALLVLLPISRWEFMVSDVLNASLIN